MSSTPQTEQRICYLCGGVIRDGAVSADHVPPKQFYSGEVRRVHNPNLLTLAAHAECNRSYQLDEEYFIHALGPMAMNSYAGASLFQDLRTQYRADRNVPLSRKVLSEFQRQPSGLIIPHKVVKRFDPDRVWRVVWKIVRGLYFHHNGASLPERTPRSFKIVPRGEKPPDEFFLLPDDPIRGLHPGVFDYKYQKFPEVNNCHLWALLFWDSFMAIIMFHDPACDCSTCTESESDHT